MGGYLAPMECVLICFLILICVLSRKGNGGPWTRFEILSVKLNALWDCVRLFVCA